MANDPFLGELEISGIIECQRKLFGQSQRRGPGVGAGIGVDSDRHEPELGTLYRDVGIVAADADLALPVASMPLAADRIASCFAVA
jgi:hypothetical protein